MAQPEFFKTTKNLHTSGSSGYRSHHFSCFQTKKSVQWQVQMIFKTYLVYPQMQSGLILFQFVPKNTPPRNSNSSMIDLYKKNPKEYIDRMVK